MPEIVEVEKLVRQLQTAWTGRKVVAFKAPAASPNPKKYAVDGWETFRDGVKNKEITNVERYAKYVWVSLENDTGWLIHLSSTGWFMPVIPEPDHSLHESFIHSVSETNIRLKLAFDDGQVWNYHDPRTWGKWRWRKYRSLYDDPLMTKYGPDWLHDPTEAALALQSSKSKRDAKDILCDQSITAGLGNYLACEVLHLAGIHPHQNYADADENARTRLCASVVSFLHECMKSEDHSHWRVFLKKGEVCRTCRGAEIEYAKDRGGSRGSYFCPECQPRF